MAELTLVLMGGNVFFTMLAMVMHIVMTAMVKHSRLKDQPLQHH
jgi:hypothetical protein